MKRILILLTVTALTLSGAVWAQSTPDSTPESTPVLSANATTLTVVTHDSFNVSESVLAAFETANDVRVQLLKSGDAGTMVNQAVLSKDAPLGDVMYGVDNTFLSRALNADLYTPYPSPALTTVPKEFQVDPLYRVTPVDYGDVCLNYDTAYFTAHKLAVPDSLKALTDPAYKSLLVVENPATSSPGLAFLLATIREFGVQGDYTYLNYWADLKANDVLVVDDWNTAYEAQFSGAAGSTGDRPLVVSYASSPPVEVYFMEQPPETAPTAAITADGACFRQIEFVGILKGTEKDAAKLAAAQKFVDFMLSREFQEDMPLQMFVYPVLPDATLPEIFTKYSTIPANPARMDSSEIDAGREQWLQAWTETVLR